MRIQIFGCGNPDRADDSAGLRVARKLRQLGLDAREHTGDMMDLMYRWAGCEQVIIVDAMVSGAAAGAVKILDPRIDDLPGQEFHGSTHEFGLAEVVDLARSLAQLPPRLTIYGIEAANCDVGGAVSDAVTTAIERVTFEIFKLVDSAA